VAAMVFMGEVGVCYYVNLIFRGFIPNGGSFLSRWLRRVIECFRVLNEEVLFCDVDFDVRRLFIWSGLLADRLPCYCVGGVRYCRLLWVWVFLFLMSFSPWWWFFSVRRRYGP